MQCWIYKCPMVVLKKIASFIAFSLELQSFSAKLNKTMSFWFTRLGDRRTTTEDLKVPPKIIKWNKLKTFVGVAGDWSTARPAYVVFCCWISAGFSSRDVGGFLGLLFSKWNLTRVTHFQRSASWTLLLWWWFWWEHTWDPVPNLIKNVIDRTVHGPDLSNLHRNVDFWSPHKSSLIYKRTKDGKEISTGSKQSRVSGWDLIGLTPAVGRARHQNDPDVVSSHPDRLREEHPKLLSVINEQLVCAHTHTHTATGDLNLHNQSRGVKTCSLAALLSLQVTLKSVAHVARVSVLMLWPHATWTINSQQFQVSQAHELEELNRLHDGEKLPQNYL